MTKRLLRPVVPVAASVALTAGTLFAVAAWRRSEDARWCREATVSALPGGTGSPDEALAAEEHAACTSQRQRQRALLGAIWRTGGREMAECGFGWASYQMRSWSDPEAAVAILQRYGVGDAGLDAGSREDQERFIRACLSEGPEAGMQQPE